MKVVQLTGEEGWGRSVPDVAMTGACKAHVFMRFVGVLGPVGSI